MSSENSNGDRREPGDRRRTVSGAPPSISTEGHGTMRFPWSSPSNSAPSSPVKETTPKSAPLHRRSTILSRFNFLRSSSGSGERPPSRELKAAKEATSPTKSFFSRKSIDDDSAIADYPVSPPKSEKEGALSLALKQSTKTRKRKGSLRKTALLGGRKNVTEGRERKGSFSLLQRSASAAKSHVQQAEIQDEVLSPPAQETWNDQSSLSESSQSRMRRQFSYEHSIATSSSDSTWSEPAAVSQVRLSLLTEQHNRQLNSRPTTVNDDGSPIDIKSPQSPPSNTSTTSDDDPLTIPAQSYFPPPRRHKSTRRSPLSRTLPPSDPAPEIPHDYTETETWGWILLLATWLTFTVGMGSCLGIWSWAWDVGETPYAPPELEDDPTLPIVGYYPALMVLTGVVGWVWVTVAWVGMKYFRHAKIEV